MRIYSRIDYGIKNVARVLKKSKVMQAVLFNIVTLAFYLIFFEVTPKADDYDMCNVLYGGIGGEYLYSTLYTSVLYGYVLKFLITMVPTIPWYYVTQFFMIFVSLCVCVWVLLERMPQRLAYIFSCVVLITGGYEFYIRFTFTKTATLLISAGLLLMLFCMYQEKLNWKRYLLGGGIAVLGVLVRYAVIKIVAVIFFGAFLLYLYDFKHITKTKYVARIMLFVLTMILLVCCNKGQAKLDNFVYSKDTLWESYLNEKAQKAALVDYEWPDYENNIKLYDELDVSKNDYVMWKQHVNINDDNVLNMDRIIQMRKFFGELRNKPRNQISQIRGVGRYVTSDITFYFTFACLVGFFFLQEREKRKKVFPILLMLILASVYMLCLGRQNHHTTGGLMWTTGLLILFYIEPEVERKKENNKKLIIGLVLIFLSFITKYYGEISNSFYENMGVTICSYDEYVSKNYDKVKQLSRRKENVYIFPMKEALRSLQCFSPWEVYEKKFYSNIIRANISFYPPYKKMLESYGIDNIWIAMIEKENVFYCLSDVNEKDIDVVEQYYKEHYSEEIKAEKIEEIEDLNIYRFVYEKCD